MTTTDSPVALNSGRQTAEELAATHDVTLAVGAAPPQLPHPFLGRNLFWWLTRMGLMTKTLESRLARRMRDRGDLVIGTPLRRLGRAGVKIRPRVVSIIADEVSFQDESAVRAATVVWATGCRADSWVDPRTRHQPRPRPRVRRVALAADSRISAARVRPPRRRLGRCPARCSASPTD